MMPHRKKSDPSPSSEAVRAWGDVVRLGQIIVVELGLEDSNDTLGRWMAHRLAELMSRAKLAKTDAEREVAQKDVSDLILALWDHRAGWPVGWPPKATAALAGRDSSCYSHSKEPSGSPWLDSLSQLEELQAREHEIWIDLALLDFDIESERRTVNELTGETANEEREAIEMVIRKWDTAEQKIRDSIGDDMGSPLARAKEGIKGLQRIDVDRKKLRKHILKHIGESEAAD